MKIVFFARRFYPLIGGVEKHVLELSRNLTKKGHQVIVITENTPKFPQFEKLENTKIEIIRISTGHDNWFKKIRIWKSLWEKRTIISSADIIHCHDVFFWYLPFRFLFPNKKVFITFHGYESYPISKKAVMVRKASELLSTGNICIGDFIKKWYGTKPTYISYGAVDVDLNKQKLKSKIKNESAVFVGRLDEQTGILTYVDAVSLIKKKYPKFIMTAVGDGAYKKRIAKGITVTGFKKNPEVFLTNAHFAFVSRYLAILEALVIKKLVFAVYDNPVKEDYLKMAPFAKYIIVAGSAKELYQKILYYLNHPQEEKKLIDKGFQWGKQQSWENMTNLYLNLWKKSIIKTS
jgi:glycosyltransferase involved in cell wall biosynthesis